MSEAEAEAQKRIGCSWEGRRDVVSARVLGEVGRQRRGSVIVLVR